MRRGSESRGRWRALLVVALLGIVCASPAAAMDEAGGEAAQPGREGAEVHALIVASHAPGDGQQPLRFAGRDAARMAAVLEELGGLSAARTQRLEDPDAAALEAALARLEATLEAAAAAGTPTVLYVYYSGHARAQALTLGDEEVRMETLRERLEAMPSAVTLVMLDACQSGAISEIKGVEPAADFSYNAAAQLGMEGLVIIASSTGSELSQESASVGARSSPTIWCRGCGARRTRTTTGR